MKKLKNGEAGFTLVELLAAIPIIGLLGLAMVGVLIQLMRSDRITQGMVIIRQVQTAGDSVSQDGVQAQVVGFNEALTDPYDLTDPGWYLNLSWGGGYVDGATYVPVNRNVTYTLREMTAVEGLYELVRYESNDNITRTVGQYLDIEQMSCQWEDRNGNGEANEEDGTLGLTVVAILGDKTEQRTYHISPRSLN